ncbi:PQQ-like beta-propeller repeat protein [Halomicroarcula sp. F13]|uniref:PQQ-like beta-propeller repeat protein n=1 Tax=Haloarcula rubra TaxID=2487747 RepID=A0AAW4PW92_9EURY|nr:PQQ-binding-like beta-propeller repeat protein [Halomicroarcula rubra]MBX0324628.1 PQQ-like beta-propeller repeat protein [Halomicroarcula rubra]
MEYTRRRLLTTVGGLGTASVAGCLDRVTGRRHERIDWYVQTEGTIGALAPADGTLTVLTMWRALSFRADGTERWRVLLDDPGDTVCYDSGLAVGDAGGTDRAYVAGCGRVQAFRVDDGSVLWETPDVASLESITTVDGRLYVSGGGLTALDGADGTVRWTALDDADGLTPPGATAETVVVGSDAGTVYALDAADGTERWRNDLGGHRIQTPTLVDGTVYVATSVPEDDRGELVALDAADGRERWRIDTGQALADSRPVVTDDTVLLGTASGSLHAHRRDTGTQRWRFDADDWLVTQPAVAPGGGTAYVGSNDGNCYAVSLADGEQRWSVAVGYSSVTPAVDGDRVFVGSHDGLFALSRD